MSSAGWKCQGIRLRREHRNEPRSELAGLRGQVRAGEEHRDSLTAFGLSPFSTISVLGESPSSSTPRSAPPPLSMLSVVEHKPRFPCPSVHRSVPRPLQISSSYRAALGTPLGDPSFRNGNRVHLLPVPASRMGAWPEILCGGGRG